MLIGITLQMPLYAVITTCAYVEDKFGDELFLFALWLMCFWL